MIRQFFEGFRKLSKSSFLFHFDFSVALNKRDVKVEKPKGIFESLLVMLSTLLASIGRTTGNAISNSFILTTFFKWLGRYHKAPFLSASFFVIGFLGVFLMKQASIAIGIGFMVAGCLLMLCILSLSPYYSGSLIQKGIDFIMKGGDPS